MEYIGIDVHKRDSQVCILAEHGEVVLEQRIRTQRERLGELLSKRPKARVLLEASTESEWVARSLEEMGHEVVVADPNFAPMYATRSRRVKTDKRDARTLAEACRLGAYRPAHRTSDEQRHMRAQLAVREALVRTRTRSISLVRALVRREGLRVADGEAESFVRRVEALALPGRLKAEVAPLLCLMRHINEQIAFLDGLLERLARRDEQLARLCTVPHVGEGDGVRLRLRGG
ncbi:IS110 family transposase [Archangium violaceum]|uniref:IS110 family transposase n=1 Tax=Archangium violaceum TaxID=83451 RepID=UPI002B2CF200|nr:IS110 family transposase [Archangium violaceum]